MTNEQGKVLEVKGTTLTVFNADPSVFLMKFRTDFPTWLADSFPLATLDLTQAGDIPMASAQLVVRTFRDLKPGGPEMLIRIAPSQEGVFRDAAGDSQIPLRVVDPEREAAERERRRKEREQRRTAPKTRPPRAGLTTQAIEMEMLEDRTESDDAAPKVIELEGAQDEASGSTPWGGPTGIAFEPAGTVSRGSAATPPAAAEPPPDPRVPQGKDQETLTLFLSSSDDEGDDIEYFHMVQDEVKEEEETPESKSRPLPRRTSEPEFSDLSGPSLRKAPPPEGTSWVKESTKATVFTAPRPTEGDRRRWPRFQVRDGFVLFKLGTSSPILKGDQLWKGPVVNISQGGVQFVTNQPLPIGKMLRMLLDLPAFLEKITVDARVIWLREIEKQGKMFHRVGVSFEKMSPEDADRMMRLESDDDMKNRQRSTFRE